MTLEEIKTDVEKIQKWIKEQAFPVSITKMRAYLSANDTSPADATWTKLALDTKNYDALNELSTTTNRFTAKQSGYYSIAAGILFKSDLANAGINTAIYKNGSRILLSGGIIVDVNKTPSMIISDIIYLDAGDYIELWYYIDYTAAAIVYGASDYTFLAIHKLS